MKWDGTLPVRRYAIFVNHLYQQYMIVVRGDDVHTAERWGGFVRWVGGVKEVVKRKLDRRRTSSNV